VRNIFQRLAAIALSAVAATTLVVLTGSVVASEISDAMVAEFQVGIEPAFTAQQGRDLWHNKTAEGRSCTSCHGDSLKRIGRHEKTAKLIEPMAPSVNSERLTSRKKINKWLLRNCKWTYRRECTAAEKGPILLWLSQQ